MASLTVIVACMINIFVVLSYDIDWSDDFTYFEAASRNPYTINMRSGTINQSLVICFEELQDTEYSGICESAKLDTITPEITFGPKSMFQMANASNPYEIQIYGAGWTNYFLLAYTNAPTAHGGPGKLVMGRYLPNEDGQIIYSPSEVTFNPYLNSNSVLIELQNNSYFIVCASVGPNSEYDTACKVGKYDTEIMSIGLGSKVFNISQGHRIRGLAVSRINGNTFLVYVLPKFYI